MATTNVNIRMDSELKKQFSTFCEDMGMNMTTAFNIFAKKAVREYQGAKGCLIKKHLTVDAEL